MTQLDLQKLTNEELQTELKKRKQNYLSSAFIVGMIIGAGIWSVAKNGFTWFLIVPFIFAYWFRNAKPEYEAVKKEIESR